MNPATRQPRHRPTSRTAVLPHAPAEDVDASPEIPRTSLPYAHLEPGDEGIWFAVACVLCSLALYAGILLTH